MKLLNPLSLTLPIFYVLIILASSLTTTPFLGPNSIYSSAGTYTFDTSPYYNTATTNLAPLTFSITFARSHTTANYSFGYSIKQITYTIVNNKINFTVQSSTKTATSVSMKYYTSNANKISSLAIAYIIIQPLFSLYDFVICWIKPNSNIFNGQYFQQTVSGVGPYTSTSQTIWAAIVGVDISMSGNNEYDLYAVATVASTTSLTFKISTISPTTFYLTSVIIEVLVWNETLLESSARSARFTTAEVNSLNSYTNTAMKSFNTIYGIRTFHTVNQAFLDYSWNLSSSVLTVTSTNSFSWVGFNYLILQFISCSFSTPYLLISNLTCFDSVPARYYYDEYNQCQSCPYDCYYCYSNGSCSQCSNTTDFREINSITMRCVPLSGYYDNNVSSTAIACNSSACLTCLSVTYCLSCYSKSYLSSNNTCLSCISNCLNCTSSTNCQLCSPYYTFQNNSCVVDCSNITNCTTCTLTNTTVFCSTCTYGYNTTNNTCHEVCGNGIKTQGESCDDGNAVNGDGCSSTCTIESGFYCAYSNGSLPNSVCSQCSNNCTTCSNATLCLNCTNNFTLTNGSCTNATSNNGANTTNTTSNTTSNSTTNSTSNTTSNTTSNSTSNSNGTNNTSNSSTTCGNGQIDTGESCDDGNTANGDGCSSICQVQPQFTCSSTPSICNINTFSSTFASLTKDQSSNQFTIQYALYPSQAYKNLNWSSIVTENSTLGVSMVSFSYDQNTGSLSLTYSYSKDINDQNLMLSYQFPNTAPFSNIQSSTTKITLSQQTSNLSLQVYSSQTYTLTNILSYLATCLSGMAFLLFICGFWNGKLIGLELITIFQLSFLSLTAITKLTPTLHSLTRLSLSCGYAIDLGASSSINNRFSAVNLKTWFFDNYNCSFLFVLVPFLLSLFHTIYAKIKIFFQRAYRPSELSKRMREEWVFYGLMFSMYICVLSFGFPFMRSSTKEIQKIGIAADAVLMAWVLWLSRQLIIRSPYMGEFVQAFRREQWPAANYYFFIVIQRILTACSLLLLTSFNIQIMVIIGLLIGQIVLVIFLKPYTLYWKRKRPLLNLSIALIIQIIYLLCQLIPLSNFKLYAPFIILGLLTISVCYNTYFFIRAACRKRTKEVEPAAKSDQTRLLERIKVEQNASLLMDQESMLKMINIKRAKEPKEDILHLVDVREHLNRIKHTHSDTSHSKILDSEVIRFEREESSEAI